MSLSANVTMSLNTNSIVLFVLGTPLLIFAGPITKFMYRRAEDSWFDTPLRRSLFVRWPIRAIGIMCIVSAFMATRSIPDRLNRDRNQLRLLEDGVIAQGEVKRAYYGIGAPAGWTVIYEFCPVHPQTDKLDNYAGFSKGPKKYYQRLSQGDAVTVIYDPCNPELNCEMRHFLNYPGFRNTFKKAGKLDLLDRFRGEYEIEDYTFKEWYREQLDG